MTEIIRLLDKPVEPKKADYYETILYPDDLYDTTLKDVLEAYADAGVTDPGKMLFSFDEGTYGDTLYGHPVELGECKFYCLKENEWNKDIDTYSAALEEWNKWAIAYSNKIKQEKARLKQERKNVREQEKARKAIRAIEKKKQEIAELESLL